MVIVRALVSVSIAWIIGGRDGVAGDSDAPVTEIRMHEP